MDEISLPYSVRLQRLRKELETTWRGRTEAIADFASIIRQVPSLIDGSLRIQQARARMNEAVDAHIQAVTLYVDLITKRSMAFGGQLRHGHYTSVN